MPALSLIRRLPGRNHCADEASRKLPVGEIISHIPLGREALVFASDNPA